MTHFLRRAFFLGLLLVAAARLSAQGARVKPANAQPSDNDWIHQRIVEFAHDSMLGRESGAIGNVKATNYIAGWLGRLKLEPAGENRTFFQAVPLDSRAPDSAGSIVVGGARFANGTDFMPVRAVAGMVMGDRTDADGERVIYGGRFGTDALLDSSKANGRIVLLATRPGLPPNASPYTDALPALRHFAGARTIIIVGYDGISAGARRAGLNAQTVLPAATARNALVVSASVARALLAASVDSATVGNEGPSATIHAGFARGPLPFASRNVIGVVRGTDATLRDEYIAVGAHSDHVGISPRPLDHDSVRAFNEVVRPLGANDPARAPTAAEAARIAFIRDSLGRIRPSKMDSVFNGADDDASGAMVVLDLARYFAQHPAKRSLVFVFHTAEEKGLYGSAYYTEHPTVPITSIVTQVNLDQVSRGGPGDVPNSQPNSLFTIGTRRLSTQLGVLVDSLNDATYHWNFDRTLDANGHPLNAYCRSDHYMYARFGIPVAFFSAGWHRDYHMVTDESDYVQMDRVTKVYDFVRDLVGTLGNRAHRVVVDQPKPDPHGTCQQ